MDLRDTVPIRGSLDLRVYRRADGIDTEIEHYREDNMIMSVARDALARLVGGDGSGKTITRIGVGLSGDGPNPGDTALTSAYIKNLSGHTYPSTGVVTFAFTIGTAEANGKNIREFGLICSDNTLFARKVRSGVIAKADDIQITGTWTINF